MLNQFNLGSSPAVFPEPGRAGGIEPGFLESKAQTPALEVTSQPVV